MDTEGIMISVYAASWVALIVVIVLDHIRLRNYMEMLGQQPKEGGIIKSATKAFTRQKKLKPKVRDDDSYLKESR